MKRLIIGSIALMAFWGAFSADVHAQSTETLGPNLINNASFESGTPSNWTKNRWSNNVGAFNYPVAGLNGGKAAQVTTTSYTSESLIIKYNYRS